MEDGTTEGVKGAGSKPWSKRGGRTFATRKAQQQQPAADSGS